MLTPIVFAGREFLLDDVDGTDYVARQMQDGGYEAPLPMLTLAILSRDTGSFCDVGANNGLYTVLACKADPGVKVFAFEPYPPALETFRRNIESNRLNDRVNIHEVALSDDAGTVDLYVPDPGHGLLETSCSLERDFKPEYGRNTLQVTRKRFDDLRVGDRPISLIKVDIEGHELAFLRGASSTIRRHRPFIFAEMLPVSKRNFLETTQIVDGFDYLKFRLRTTMAILTAAIIVDEQACNYAFVPREKVALFEVCCRTHGLELFREY